MKTRNGFVSNSSSTSFVLALREDFEVTAEMLSFFGDDDWKSQYIKDIGGAAFVAKKMNQVIKESILDGSGFPSYALPEYGHGDFFALVHEVLGDFVVATVHVGEGDGTIVAIDSVRTLEILKNKK